ncbi:hypothetical protein DFH07DRAFT_980903 [Mycena maculata]|uniref:Chromo domain-containing protein n=1 Tax=Mycena maculata TaxID=230809 RepID=A0AAD7NUK4_9AGAR|nr:hypothetical protein DFH07DRAFT_980903 [Mycena maculata]
MTEDFYVKKVLKARLDSGRRRQDKYWSYFTSWENYESSENSWERTENFRGSKYALKLFWKNVDIGGRDHKNLSLFKVGEVIELRESSTPSKDVPKRKPGPGRSSAGLLGTKVFALWAEDQHYYAAEVQQRQGKKYLVKFYEDHSELTVSLKEMRPCSGLRPSDTVIQMADEIRVFAVGEDGTLTLKKRADVTAVKLSAWAVENEWQDRMLSHKDIICASG